MRNTESGGLKNQSAEAKKREAGADTQLAFSRMRDHYWNAKDPDYNAEDVEKIIRAIKDKVGLRLAGRAAAVGEVAGNVAGFAAAGAVKVWPVLAVGGVLGAGGGVAGGFKEEQIRPKTLDTKQFTEMPSKDESMKVYKGVLFVPSAFNEPDIRSADARKIREALEKAGFKFPPGGGPGRMEMEQLSQAKLGLWLDRLEGSTGIALPDGAAEWLGLKPEVTVKGPGGKIGVVDVTGLASNDRAGGRVEDLSAPPTPHNRQLAADRAQRGKATVESLLGVKVNTKVRLPKLEKSHIDEFSRLAAATKSPDGRVVDAKAWLELYNKNPDAVEKNSELRRFLDTHFGNARGVEIEYTLEVPEAFSKNHPGFNVRIAGASALSGVALAGLGWLTIIGVGAAMRRRKEEEPNTKEKAKPDTRPIYSGPTEAPKTRTYGTSESDDQKFAARLKDAIKGVRHLQNDERYKDMRVYVLGHDNEITIEQAVDLAQAAMEVPVDRRKNRY